MVIDRLRSAGVDTSRSLDIAHRLRFQDEASARLAAEFVHKRGRTVVVDRDADGSGCHITIFVRHDLTLEAIGTDRAEFEAVGGGMGGSYQGWSLVGYPVPEAEGDR